MKIDEKIYAEVISANGNFQAFAVWQKLSKYFEAYEVSFFVLTIESS